MNELDKWLNNVVLAKIDSVGLESYALPLPFRAGFIHNFFKPKIFEELRRANQNMDRSKFNLHPCHYLYSPFLHKEFFRFINGKDFLSFLGQLSGKRVSRYDKYPYPQVHHFKASATGLDIHTDYGTGRQFATLMYLNNKWSPGMGGELLLFKKHVDQFIQVAKVEPQPNTLFFFEVTPNSYHAVAPMNGNWQRDTVITDWRLL